MTDWTEAEERRKLLTGQQYRRALLLLCGISFVAGVVVANTAWLIMLLLQK